MQDRELYARILGVERPWHVIDVALHVEAGRVEVMVEHRGALCCPRCGKACAGYDVRRRQWRHLDTCQFRTLLTADVPRVTCEEHGVLQIEVPWAEPNSRFTALFERVVIDWLREASTAAVSRRMQLSWAQVDGIMARAVARGLARRDEVQPRRIGIDETAYQKRHEYVTVVTDLDESRVLWDYVRPSWARRAWQHWLGWASRCRLKPMVQVARMIRKHLDGIVNAVVLRATNALSESMNAKIQRVKARACGDRNRERFRNAILFHLGGLDLHPRPSSTHTDS